MAGSKELCEANTASIGKQSDAANGRSPGACDAQHNIESRRA